MFSYIERGKVLALHVLDQLKHRNEIIGNICNQAVNFLPSQRSDTPPAPLSNQDDISVAVLPDHDRLHQPVLTDAFGQFLVSMLISLLARLLGVGVYFGYAKLAKGQCDWGGGIGFAHLPDSFEEVVDGQIIQPVTK